MATGEYDGNGGPWWLKAAARPQTLVGLVALGLVVWLVQTETTRMDVLLAQQAALIGRVQQLEQAVTTHHHEASVIHDQQMFQLRRVCLGISDLTKISVQECNQPWAPFWTDPVPAPKAAPSRPPQSGQPEGRIFDR